MTLSTWVVDVSQSEDTLIASSSREVNLMIELMIMNDLGNGCLFLP